MISRSVYDAWKIKPPCETEMAECSKDCPYWTECMTDDIEDEI